MMHWCAIKVLQAFAAMMVLNIEAVFSLKAFPFKLREVSNNTVYEGPEPRIYGGMVAPESKFPFMIFAMMKISGQVPSDKASQCSASLVQPNFVLLAAHCVDFKNLLPNDIITVGGRAYLSEYVRARIDKGFYYPLEEAAYGIQERRAMQYFVHPNYSKQPFQHDVALIKLAKPFVLDSFIKLIPISQNQIKKKKSCTILGWGLSLGNKQDYSLKYVENKIVSTTALGCLVNNKKGRFICLMPDYRGICQGDSGSPLVCDGEVWGVASHLASNSQNPDCGDSVEEYYTEIHADLGWMRSIYNSGNLCSAISLKNVLFVLSGLLLSATI